MGDIRILIVDDVPFMRQFIKNCLIMSTLHFIVDEAGTGKAVINKLSEDELEPFDLILCDWELPDLTGDEILKWVRTESDFPDLPFIMVTGNTDRERILKAVGLGVTDYIVKPVKCDTLATKIVAALKKLRPEVTGGEG